MSDKRKMEPFNFKILELNPERLAPLRPTTSLNIFNTNSKEFDENGLFSTLTFGVPGDDRRDYQFSYVDLKCDIFHPYAMYIFKSLKRLYIEIMTRKAYAVWDEELNDFVRANPLQGNTGFNFFFQYWDKINHRRTKSRTRDLLIDVLEKNKGKWLTRYVLILPAGLRDIDFGATGKIKKDPINNEYLRLIGVANNNPKYPLGNLPDNDQTRGVLQDAFNKIYDYFRQMVNGKTGFWQAKLSTRAVFYGTRNVITSNAPATEDASSPQAYDVNRTVIGFYQHCKSIEPKTISLLKNGFISKVFGGNLKARLVNTKTLNSEWVEVSRATYDLWSSSEGLAKIINRLVAKENRNKPILIDGYYIGLVYLDDTSFKFFHGLEELPLEFNKKNVYPITLLELVYLSGYLDWNKYPTYVTRYPAITIGSIYPSKPYVKTSTKGLVRQELGDDFKPKGVEFICYEYPDRFREQFVESMSPHVVRWGLLGADADGDTSSYNAVMTDEAIAEANYILSTVEAYIDPAGGLKTSFNIPPLKAVFHNLLRRD